jgi:hypothetical protein
MKNVVIVFRFIAIVILALLVLRSVASAQQGPQPDMAIDAAVRSTVIENLIKELNDS